MSFWDKVKDYIGIGLTNAKETLKNVEVKPTEDQTLVPEFVKKESTAKKPAKKTTAKK
jgi:hypothetical protein